MKRVTLSLPDSVADDLRYCSAQLGFSQSALLGAMLEVPLEELRTIVGDLPLSGEVSGAKRARGESFDGLRAMMRGVRDDLARMRDRGDL